MMFVLDPDKSVMVDLDGVLHPYSKGWNNGELYDEPVEGSKSFLESLKNKGYQIIVFTARFWNRNTKDLHDMIKAWLEKYDLPYDYITGRKLPCVAYIDDRAIHFNGSNWSEVLEKVDKLSQYQGSVINKDI